MEFPPALQKIIASKKTNSNSSKLMKELS